MLELPRGSFLNCEAFLYQVKHLRVRWGIVKLLGRPNNFGLIAKRQMLYLATKPTEAVLDRRIVHGLEGEEQGRNFSFLLGINFRKLLCLIQRSAYEATSYAHALWQGHIGSCGKKSLSKVSPGKVPHILSPSKYLP